MEMMKFYLTVLHVSYDICISIHLHVYVNSLTIVQFEGILSIVDRRLQLTVF